MKSNIDSNKEKCNKFLNFYNICSKNLKNKDIDENNFNYKLCTVFKINWESCLFKSFIKKQEKHMN